jgi:tRNA U34 2-thiouridine synthase MnmA/TrmU
LRQRATLTSATIVDVTTGEELGRSDAAELMTVGQRRGVRPGRDGERRYVSRVDLVAGRVEVGRLEEIMVSSLSLDGASLTFARGPLR